MCNHSNIKNAIKRLPERLPNKGTWNKIEQGLDEQGNLKNLLTKLPQHQPSGRAWQKIEDGLAQKRSVSYPSYMGIAAAVLVLVALTILLMQKKTGAEKVTVNYSVEFSNAVAVPELDFSSTQKAQEYLLEICKSFESNCNSDEFTQLKIALVQTGEAIEKTEGILATFPNDPDLQRQLLQFKKQENKITRDLLVLTMKES